MSVITSGAVAKHVSFERERGVYEVQVTPDLAHFVVTVASDVDRPENISRIFANMNGCSIPIFFIKLHRAAVSFAVQGDKMKDTEMCLKEHGWDFSMRRDLALVSVIASNMRDLTGCMVAIADALQRASARLYGVSDSHTSVQCLINSDRTGAALNELKLTFHLEDSLG
jgi:aspartate kinase